MVRTYEGPLRGGAAGRRQKVSPDQFQSYPDADAVRNAAELAEALDARPSGDGWQARCPAHDDRTPSLSIGAGSDGAPLVHCHAGCEQEAVLEALRGRGL